MLVFSGINKMKLIIITQNKKYSLDVYINSNTLDAMYLDEYSNDRTKVVERLKNNHKIKMIICL